MLRELRDQEISSNPPDVRTVRKWKAEAATDEIILLEHGYIVGAAQPDRLGIVIWNEEENEVHLVELTVPHEDNINLAHERKDNRYEALVEECEEAGWIAMHFPVEVGSRGFIATCITKWMRVVGLGPKKRNTITKALQVIVEKASHWIWLKREDTSWSES